MKHQKKVFILRDNGVRDGCKTYLDTLKLEPEIFDLEQPHCDKSEEYTDVQGTKRYRCEHPPKPIKVTAEPYKKNRSLAQQALSWIWHKQWSDYTGDTTDAEHLRFKAVFLLPILIRDNVIPGLYFLVLDAKQKALEGNTDRLQAIYRLISTTSLEVSQFAEILTQYQADAAEKGCFFTVRAPEYYEAFNIKEK